MGERTVLIQIDPALGVVVIQLVDIVQAQIFFRPTGKQLLSFGFGLRLVIGVNDRDV